MVAYRQNYEDAESGNRYQTEQKRPEIYIRKCSKPETKAREIYDALGYKYEP